VHVHNKTDRHDITETKRNQTICSTYSNSSHVGQLGGIIGLNVESKHPKDDSDTLRLQLAKLAKLT
jgi:hypothetical protein